MDKINKLYGYVAQHRGYFIIMANGIQSLKIVNHYAVDLKLIKYCK